jgi:6-phosphogluconolactonase
MRIRTWLPGRRLLGPLVLSLLGATAAVAPAVAAANDRPASAGQVYVNDNTAGANTVAGFARHRDDTLSPLRGSPFRAGGAGTGSGLASQGAVQLADNGRFLIAVDAGSDQVSVLRVHGDGRPKLAGVFASGGSEPVSVAVHRDLVYVANAGDADSNYTGFRLRPNGRLEHIAGSTVPLPAGSQPGDVLFSPDGTHVAGTRVNSSLIDSFAVGRDGRLTAAPGSPYAAQGLGPFGSEFRPTNPDQLFVSNAHDGAGAGTVSAFDVARDGTLSSIAGSPFPNGQTAPCWVEITHDGRFLFAVNTASGTISRYSIAPGGELTLLGNTPVNATGGVGAVDARLAPDGRTLYVDESRIASIGAFAVDGGTLTELGGSPAALPAGATPAGVAVR